MGYVVNTTNLVDSTPDAIREALAQQLDQMVDGIVIIAPQTPVLDVLNELELTFPYAPLHFRSPTDPHELFVDQLAVETATTRHLLDLDHRSIHHLAGHKNGWKCRRGYTYSEPSCPERASVRQSRYSGIGPPSRVIDSDNNSLSDQNSPLSSRLMIRWRWAFCTPFAMLAFRCRRTSVSSDSTTYRRLPISAPR